MSTLEKIKIPTQKTSDCKYSQLLTVLYPHTKLYHHQSTVGLFLQHHLKCTKHSFLSYGIKERGNFLATTLCQLATKKFYYTVHCQMAPVLKRQFQTLAVIPSIAKTVNFP